MDSEAMTKAIDALRELRISELDDLRIECEHEVIRRTGDTPEKWREFMHDLWRKIDAAERQCPVVWRLPVMARFKSLAREIERELTPDVLAHIEMVTFDGSEWRRDFANSDPIETGEADGLAAPPASANESSAPSRQSLLSRVLGRFRRFLAFGWFWERN